MFNIDNINYESKEEYYEDILLKAKGLIYEERDWVANMANISALLFNTMEKINWAGFYILKNNQLVLGPFQGKPACIRINLDSGVCGKAATKLETQVVKNVHKFEGHIACDSDTNSEIVIPLIKDEKLIGVLDIDSPVFDRFDIIDKDNLEKLANILINNCDF